jgi:hypothetical protein
MWVFLNYHPTYTLAGFDLRALRSSFLGDRLRSGQNFPVWATLTLD